MARRTRNREDERTPIRAAADRLLAGTPLRSTSGRPTVTEPITECGLRRDVVHEHGNLVGKFKARRKTRHATPTALRELTDRNTALVDELVLDGAITARIRHRLGRAHERIDRGELPALREYDPVGGMTGLGAYLLHQGQVTLRLRDVLGYLTRLTHPIRSGTDELPGWWTRDSPTGQPSPHWPGGHLNLGIAHGCTGVLALCRRR
ncbi:lanthionine synthetase LanC family protein [Embleya hyalina]|uniref:Uncharacterized protein n=1 Tax=Embleya hyalina TaxID=516124 RepID=A0A401Z141_9ACTN|nr:lanthionine synthetase LanC family protein [Embleya hyalina]GCE00620.1 hypothetical protein EHYA_08346 [Embleya hyalina]